MWKAILVLFMTSTGHPAYTMVGQFPQIFMTESECKEFVAKTRGEVDDTVKVFSKYADLGFTVVHHDFDCLEATSGEPA